MLCTDTRKPNSPPPEKPISVPNSVPKNPGYNEEDDHQKKRGPGEEGIDD